MMADLTGVNGERGLRRGAGALGNAESADLAHQLLQPPELDVALHDFGAVLVAQLRYSITTRTSQPSYFYTPACLTPSIHPTIAFLPIRYHGTRSLQALSADER